MKRMTAVVMLTASLLVCWTYYLGYRKGKADVAFSLEMDHLDKAFEDIGIPAFYTGPIDGIYLDGECVKAVFDEKQFTLNMPCENRLNECEGCAK